MNKKLKEWFRHQGITAGIGLAGAVLFVLSGFLLGRIGDAQAPVDSGAFMYIAVGIVNLAASCSFVWLVFGLFFPTINRDLDAGEFANWWKQSSPEVKLCVAVSALLALLFVSVFALHP